MTLEEIELETATRINAALARSLEQFGAPSQLEQCAMWHEHEAARYHAMRQDACVDGDPAMARSMAETEQMHAGFAVACREAHGN